MPTVRRPGPYTLEIDYVYSGLSHSLSLNCDTLGTFTPGTPADDVTMKTKDGTGVSLQQFADDIWGVLRAFFAPATLASTFTLWKRNIHNAEKDFISAGGLTSPNGSSGLTAIPSSQSIWTWRSSNGGIIKINILEATNPSAPTLPMLSDTTVGVSAMNTYMQSDTTAVMALDRGFAVAAGNSNYGQNEKIFNIRNRH